MRNSYSPIPKKKRNFKPSISLAEFAEIHDLNLFELVAKIAASTDIKSRYTRGPTPYYHISEVKAWLANNTVTARASV